MSRCAASLTAVAPIVRTGLVQIHHYNDPEIPEFFNEQGSNSDWSVITCSSSTLARRL